MPHLSPARTARITGLMLLLSLGALLAPSVGADVTGLVRVVDFDAPYFASGRPALMYLLMPAAVLGAFVLVMAPGLLLALALGRGRDVHAWLVDGFVLSLLVLSACTAILQRFADAPLTGSAFVASCLGLTFLCGLLAIRRSRIGQIPDPVPDRGAARVAALSLALPVLLVIPLAPKVFWESFNGDGAHAFWSARLLLSQSIPFFSPEAGTIADWPGVSGLTYPYVPSWFLRMFGEVEAAVRLPFFLLLPILHASIVSLTAAAGGKRPGAHGQWLIGASLLSFALILVYSATYNPYMADMSMPGVMDLLVLVFAFAAYTAHARRERVWLASMVLLGLMTSPAALTMFGFMLLAVFATTRPLPWRRTLFEGLGLLGCMVLLSGLGWVFQALGTPAPGGEHGVIGLLRENYSVVSVVSVERFLYVVLACGIYPLWCFVVWRRADALARALMLVAIAQFAMYYVMGAAALHYFVPAMVLPVIAFWRVHGSGVGPRPLALCWTGAAVCVFAALPASTAIHGATREIGEQIEVVGYEPDDPAALDASLALFGLFQRMSHPSVPERRYGGPPIGWLYYALFTREPGTEPVYGLVRGGQATAREGLRIDEQGEAEARVYDEEAWRRMQTARPRSSLGRSVFLVPRAKLFAFRATETWGAVRTGAIIERVTGSGESPD